MHKVTIRFDRVFDVQAYARNHMPATYFSFECVSGRPINQTVPQWTERPQLALPLSLIAIQA